MTALVFVLLLLGGGAVILLPLTRRVAWPLEGADDRDDVARAVSSLRDLEFAKAAGTIAPEDHARLTAALAREAFVRPSRAAGGTAPIRTIALAALLAGVAVVLVTVSLPQAAGDRAPGETVTGTVPRGSTLADLEGRAKASPRDVPTQLALADAYLSEGRPADAASAYRAVLAIDRDNVAALDGIALVLELAGERDGALVAVQRVLQLRPRDPDALFLRGLIAYKQGDWKNAVAAWQTYLEVGEFHPGAEMVRPLYDDAKRKLNP